MLSDVAAVWSVSHPGNRVCKCLHRFLQTINTRPETHSGFFLNHSENCFTLGHTSFACHHAFQKLCFLELKLSEESRQNHFLFPGSTKPPLWFSGAETVSMHANCIFFCQLLRKLVMLMAIRSMLWCLNRLMGFGIQKVCPSSVALLEKSDSCLHKEISYLCSHLQEGCRVLLQSFMQLLVQSNLMA